MENEKQDVDKLEMLADSMNGLVDVGEAVMEDGVIDFKDLEHAGKFGEEAKKFIVAVKAYKEMVAEAKDIDPIEAVKIVQVLFAKK